ncbi:MAG: hypothetical protein ACTHU0_19085 [Kofleriaceae bacterium]
MTRLAPHESFLASLPERAAERYRNQLAPAFAARWPSVRAGEIQALMIELMTAYDGANMVFVQRRWLWRATCDLFVQFKLLDKMGRPQNYPTPGAVEFDEQLDLDGAPGMRVTLGYTLDEETSGVVSVRIVGQDGPRILFSRSLFAAQEVLPLHAPLASSPVQAPAPLRLQPIREADADASAQKKQMGGSEEP